MATAPVMVWPEGYKTGEPHGGGIIERRGIIARCLWCGQSLVDGASESGWTGEGPDYMTPDGDFGCDRSPDTGKDGCGSHAPNTFRTWDGHTIRFDRDSWSDTYTMRVVRHNESHDHS